MVSPPLLLCSDIVELAPSIDEGLIPHSVSVSTCVTSAGVSPFNSFQALLCVYFQAKGGDESHASNYRHRHWHYSLVESVVEKAVAKADGNALARTSAKPIVQCNSTTPPCATTRRGPRGRRCRCCRRLRRKRRRESHYY